MQQAIKRRLKMLLFTPGLGALLPHGHRRPVGKPRPFWGIVRNAVGGPAVRTRRMISAFGNALLWPDIIYAQSAWNGEELAGAIAFRRRNTVPMVFNQNGWYYPGWYDGDWRQSNDRLVAAQQAADHVIYQSRFCLEAGRALTGYVAPRYTILHNAVPSPVMHGPRQSDGRTCWLSAVFTPDSEHILRPALQAFKLLRRRHPAGRAPRLIIAGRIPAATRQQAWFQSVEKEIRALLDEGGGEWLGEYRPSDLPLHLMRADLALHLKYKDPCPNAVIERMACGLPHVFSNSGGTPELIANAGIALEVPDTWEYQASVDPEQLASAIEQGLMCREELSAVAKQRAAQYSWQNYLECHRQLFVELLNAGRRAAP